MTILLSARDLAHAFGARTLFSGVSFTLHEGDRIGLIGPNGAGKSTLLSIIAGQLTPDGGELAPRAGLRVGYLAQTPEFPPGLSVREAVALGLHRGQGKDSARVDEVLARFSLGAGGEVDADAPLDTLSGGWRKRVALARELCADPDLLLLDEPTNHLDIEAIVWLERLLGSAPFATLTVTHDRAFLQNVARRIFELDRRNAQGLLAIEGDYATYVERKADAMAAQEQREMTMRNTLRRETEWLRRGPAARSTKQKARIDRADKLAQDVAELRERNRTRVAEIDLAGSGRKTRKLIEAKDLSKRFGDQPIFEGVDLLLGPGTRLSLLGPNGCGKTTLLRVLLGLEPPSGGTVEHAPELSVQLFEQHRESLDPEATVADAVAPGAEMVDFGGSRLHRIGYLERFLFRREQAHMRVGDLSGGEQSRLLVARLMLKPADVLVLDEPTNDLDFDTLDVLQESLARFKGAVLLVSHDRYFVDQVSTRILAFHTAAGERGRTTQFADLHQWQQFHAAQREAPATKKAPRAAAPRAATGKPKRLSYKDQRDWDTLEQRITDAERELAEREAQCSRPEVASDGARLLELSAEMTKLQESIDAMYARWAELEELQRG